MSGSLVRKSMMLPRELEASRSQLRFDFMDQSGVSQWIPGFDAGRGRDIVDRPTVDQFCATR